MSGKNWLSTLSVVIVVCAGFTRVTPAFAQSAGSISEAPVWNAPYGARNPRKCAPVTHLPSATEAAALAQCYSEKMTREQMYLWQNVAVQMGSSRPYAYNADSTNASIDTTEKVYPIRVTGDRYVCIGGPTCNVQHASNSPGTCYKTTFGDWSCSFSQVFGLEPNSTKMPGPRTY